MAKSSKAKSLVIVESPTKAKTINKFLGSDYVVESSFGHVRDLPKSKIGIDVENNFEPKYVVPTKAKARVAELKKLAKSASKVILATDEDREGEAIAWHLQSLLDLADNKYERIVFHEITQDAIEQALEHPRKIDSRLVDAQQARRILDRLVGYNLSPLLWIKIRYGLSAGRVQSAALRLIVEREREIEKFNPQEYWSITSELEKNFPAHQTESCGAVGSFNARLNKIDGKTIDKLAIKNEAEAKEIVQTLQGVKWQVENIETKSVVRNPSPPFTTSTLQQEANRKLNFSGKQTMMVAQQLYEGIELGSEGSIGLITYMRTDSVNLSTLALNQAKEVIAESFGKKYVLDAPRAFKTKSKGAQEAHEAIRPTSLLRKPEDIKSFLDAKQFKLYDLIWKRTVATQMPEAQFKATSVDISTRTKYTFRATGQVLIFDGFLKVYFESTDDLSEEEEGILPELSVNEILKLLELAPNQHFTEPKPRYTDASLIKALEEFGIGRPSTYAPTIGTLIEREYVTRDQKKLTPTEVGILVTDFLKEHFADIVDYQFTAHMEEELDEIAEGNREWQPIIRDFYNPFSKKVEEKKETIEKLTEPITDKCPLCGSSMVAKFGRFGKFGACEKYPECKGRIPLEKEEIELASYAKTIHCPECGGEMIVRKGRFGSFLGCAKYPECKGIAKIEKKFGPCPECHQGTIVEKRGGKGKRIFYACNRYPDCKYIAKKKPETAMADNNITKS